MVLHDFKSMGRGSQHIQLALVHLHAHPIKDLFG